MSETDRLTNEEKERQGVLLKARRALMVILGYEASGSEEELAEITADYLSLIEENPWLDKGMGFRGDQEITPLSELSRSLTQAFGKGLS